jgi:hypothetical protein
MKWKSRKNRGEDDFRDQTSEQRIAAGCVNAVSVRGEAIADIEVGLATGNDVEHAGAGASSAKAGERSGPHCSHPPNTSQKFRRIMLLHVSRCSQSASAVCDEMSLVHGLRIP